MKEVKGLALARYTRLLDEFYVTHRRYPNEGEARILVEKATRLMPRKSFMSVKRFLLILVVFLTLGAMIRHLNLTFDQWESWVLLCLFASLCFGGRE